MNQPAAPDAAAHEAGAPSTPPCGLAAPPGDTALLELLPIAIYTIDAEARITFFNSAAARLWGRRPVLGEERWCGAARLFRLDGRAMALAESPIAIALKEQRPLHGEEAIAERPDGTRYRFLAFPTPLFDADGRIAGAISMLIDITESRAAERAARQQELRFETLNAVSQILSSDLDLRRVVQKATDAATSLSGAKFGAFFHNAPGPEGGAYELFALSGAPREAFEPLGRPRVTAIFAPTFHGEAVRSDDIRTDPRYGRNAPHHGLPKGHLPVTSYLAVPVVSRSGAVLGGLFFGHDEPGRFTEETERLVAGIASHAAIAIDNAQLLTALNEELAQRRETEEANRLLLGEIRHRVKNALMTTQAIAARSFPNVDPTERAAFSERLRVLARTQDVLSAHDWSNAPARRVVERALAPFRGGEGCDLFEISGDPATLDASRATLLALALHELAMNAVKHGALSAPEGRVALSWKEQEENGERRLVFEWRERGGPPVAAPNQRGFGLGFLDRSFFGVGVAEVNFDPAGFSCRLELLL